MTNTANDEARHAAIGRAMIEEAAAALNVDLDPQQPDPAADMPCMAMVSDRRARTGFRSAAGHDHLLATGPECNDAWPAGQALPQPGDTPAPSLAAEVAALRADLLVTRMGGDRRDMLLARLDRIAAAVPQPERRCRFKSAHSCRGCGRWLEGDWNAELDQAKRVEIQRQMDAGHCDACHERVCK